MIKDIVEVFLLIILTQVGMFFVTWTLAWGEVGTSATKWYSWTSLSLANLVVLLFFWLPAILLFAWFEMLIRVLS